jgi:CRP-like cAMP-binding protein
MIDNSINNKDILFDFVSRYVSLTEDEKNFILSFDIFRTVKKRTSLLKEGQLSKESYLVLKGCIRTYYNVDGDEKTTNFYTELDVLIPTCISSKAPAKYYVSCVEDTVLAVSNTDMEAKLFKKFPKFESFSRILSEELLTQQQINFDEFKTSSPEQRYQDILEKRPDLIQRVPQHQLASYLGVIPQSLSRLKARILVKMKD